MAGGRGGRGQVASGRSAADENWLVILSSQMRSDTSYLPFSSVSVCGQSSFKGELPQHMVTDSFLMF